MAARWADDDNPLDDREFPDEADTDDGSPPLMDCPHCRLPIMEDSPQCPHCHQWVASGPHSWGPQPWYHRHGLWAVRTILMNWLAWLVVAIAAIALWLFGIMR